MPHYCQIWHIFNNYYRFHFLSNCAYVSPFNGTVTIMSGRNDNSMIAKTRFCINFFVHEILNKHVCQNFRNYHCFLYFLINYQMYLFANGSNFSIIMHINLSSILLNSTAIMKLQIHINFFPLYYSWLYLWIRQKFIAILKLMLSNNMASLIILLNSRQFFKKDKLPHFKGAWVEYIF